MPPAPSWHRGRQALTAFLRVGPLSGDWRWRHVFVRASGQPALAFYSWDEPEGAYLAFALNVLTIRGDRISDVTAFIARSTESSDPETYRRWPEEPIVPERFVDFFERFGLPERLD
jgi:RNA polymerase sigma-70 factor (ECF subfamily)